MSFLIGIVKRIFGFEDDASGRGENSRPEELSQRSCPPQRVSEQRSPAPAVSSVQQRYSNKNETPAISARESQPRLPERTSVRFYTSTPESSPSVLQRGFVDSYRAPAASNPLPKPSSSSSSFSEPARKPSASSVIDPPKTPSFSNASDSPKKTPGSSSATANWRPTDALPVYSIPSDIKRIIEKDEVPEALRKPLSPSNYADHFAALLYAEDYYMEKWSNFLKNYVLSGVTLRLREETTSAKSRDNRKVLYVDRSDKPEKKVYVEFDMDSIPEKRPYLLSRDYVYVRRSGENAKPFQGFLVRVVKSKFLWAEFRDDFFSQHSPTFKYDIWFDFNRVCLKRSHQGVSAAVDSSLRRFLFPDIVSRNRRQIPTFIVPSNKFFNEMQISAVHQILSLKGPPPYLIVEGGSSMRTREVINEAVLQIYKTFRDSRILIVAPQNRTCDSLMRGLKEEIPDSEMFRANAAFRERDDVPDDILSFSMYEGECFTCPPPEDLRKFRVISSTFMSSFRLHSHGIHAGHFSHIFVVDACDVTEPETMVTLANLADESTVVVLAGDCKRYPIWVRADIARENGLRISYFKRLLESEPYKSRDPGFVMHV